MDYELLAQVRALLEAGDHEAARERLRALRSADLADVVEHLEPAERQAVFDLLDDETASAVMGELDEAVAATIVRALPASRAADILEEMPADEAADVLQDLPTGAADALLAQMNAEDAEEVRELLEYPENTAGGRMVSDYVTVPETATVASVMDQLRAHPPRPDTSYYLYVCDAEERLTGVVSLRDLVVADPNARVSDIMTRDVVRVRPDTDQEAVADLVARYDLLAVPVVDAENRVLGVVTVDDVLDVLQEEATEDILHLSSGAEPVPETVVSSARTRLQRMATTIVAGMVAAAIIASFREVFRVRLAYLLFLPLALTVSEVVTGQVMASVGAAMRRGAPSGRLARTIAREVGLTAIVAAGGGGLVAVLLGHWQQLPRPGLSLGAAVVLVALVSALVGGLLPVLARLVREDPSAIPVSVAAALADTLAVAVFLWVVVTLG